MKILGWVKRLFLGLAGVVFTFPVQAQDQEAPVRQADPQAEEPEKARFSQDELIDSLRQMNRNPEKVQTVCAMCYEMMVLPKEIELSCEKCGRKMLYPRGSDQGNLVHELPYIKRSLAQMPYKINVDASGLCQDCGKDKAKVLVMQASCFNCGKDFSWEVKDYNQAMMLKWLYLKPPIKEIDGTDLGVWGGKDKNLIKQGAEYIRDHVFCPVCRDKINLEE